MVTTGKKITIPLFCVIFFIAASQFIVPYIMEPGTVRHMDANANMMDHSNFWNTLTIYPRIIYYFGDFNCHQMEHRSFVINGNQMPMCARDAGIFVGLSVGLLIPIILPARETASEIILKLFPRKISHKIRRTDKRIRKKTGLDIQFSPLLAIISILFALSMVIDGSVQMFSSYESTNPMRVITGLLFGFTSFLWFSSYIHSVLYVPELPKYLFNGPTGEVR
jgi:uncharacterized membrane protein